MLYDLMFPYTVLYCMIVFYMMCIQYCVLLYWMQKRMIEREVVQIYDRIVSVNGKVGTAMDLLSAMKAEGTELQLVVERPEVKEASFYRHLCM